MKRLRPLVVACLGVAAIACANGVGRTVERRLTLPDSAQTLDHRSPYLKAHLRGGFVYVFDSWRWSDSAGMVTGTGTLYDANRAVVGRGNYALSRDSVALFETNVSRVSKGAIALTVMAGVTAAVATACLLNPKACFGSCPTFYASDSTGRSLLQAEAFSASIAPGLEAADVDALYRARPSGRDFTLHLTNEALETHVIRYADLLVAPRPPNGRVFATADGRFVQATALTSPTRCSAAEGDCRAAIEAYDERERFTAADSRDLASRETIELEFDRVPAGPLGLVIASRQSLMTTYLIYQALAYMGSDASRWLAALPPRTDSSRQSEEILGRLLGRIVVMGRDDSGTWRSVGRVGETGPIASDTKLVRLTQPANRDGRLRLQLELTKGLWRLDWIALAALGQEVVPSRIAPRAVRRAGQSDSTALRSLVDRREPLTTGPGDALDLDYRLPSEPERYELFLEARGYYLEWMRREWVADANPKAARQLLLDPAGMLRELAPVYKRQEAGMEEVFWRSRYVRP